MISENGGKGCYPELAGEQREVRALQTVVGLCPTSMKGQSKRRYEAAISVVMLNCLAAAPTNMLLVWAIGSSFLRWGW